MGNAGPPEWSELALTSQNSYHIMILGQKSGKNFIKKSEKSYFPIKLTYEIQISEPYVKKNFARYGKNLMSCPDFPYKVMIFISGWDFIKSSIRDLVSHNETYSRKSCILRSPLISQWKIKQIYMYYTFLKSSRVYLFGKVIIFFHLTLKGPCRRSGTPFMNKEYVRLISLYIMLLHWWIPWKWTHI